MPSTVTWKGTVSNLWSNPANWVEGRAPAAGDDLVFPANAVRFGTLQNDLPAGTVFNSLTLTAFGGQIAYTLTGNAIGIGGGGISDTTTSFAVDRIDLNIALVTPVSPAAGVGAELPFVVTSGSPILEINGVISGVGGITKSGVGVVELRGANTYAAGTTISAGVIHARNGSALGSTGRGTTVQAGAALWLDPPEGVTSLSVPEPLTLNGNGVPSTVATGAARVASGLVTLTGDVTLASSTAIGTDPFGSDTEPRGSLIIQGTVHGGPTAELRKLGGGQLILAAANDYQGPTTVADGQVTVSNPLGLGSTAAGTTVLAGGVMAPAYASSQAATEPLTLDGRGSLDRVLINPDTVPRTWAGPITLASDSAVGAVSTSGPLTLSGTISGPGGLRNNGVGTVILGVASLSLTAGNTYTGATIADNGTTEIDIHQPSSRVILDGGTLTGLGTVGATSGSSGLVNPGGPNAGTLTIQGDLALGSGVTDHVDLFNNSGRGNDLLIVNGGVRLDGPRLELAPSPFFNTNVGDVLTLISNDGTDPIVGTFAGLPDNAQLTILGRPYRINYDGGSGGNDVTLTRLPGLTAFRDRSVTTPIHEGQTAILSGTIVEEVRKGRFFLQIDWGDGSPVRTLRFPPGSDGRTLHLAHRYTTAGSFRIHLAWGDQRGVSNTDILPINVLNVAPTVSAGGHAFVFTGQTFRRAGSFTDPGTQETYTATVDYGDGTSPQPLALHHQRFVLGHAYATPGTYRVIVTIADNSGGAGTASFFVIASPRRRPGLASLRL
ncbi:MAG: autotransporter-associated beta strand repeat-containing protein [Isosphaeraceae bacterium]|nr:autotransporter-associated beta strand repeat-containing protein [Isosphaeraceae bacterium]